MSPRFSVVIPAYQAEATLARAIDSVLDQTWPAEEVLVVDDGSSDRTGEIARAYGPPVRLLRQDNAGVSAARNLGAREARGDWLAFLDADDWYYPERLAQHARWIAKDPGLDFLTGDYEYRDPSGRLLGTSLAEHAAGRSVLARCKGGRALLAPEEIESFVHDHFGDTHTLSVPRRTFLALGGYPLGFKVCEDVHFLVRLVARSRRIGVVCSPLGVYLIHGASATRSDRVAAQEENVRTLMHLRAQVRGLPAPVRRGVARRLCDARANLGYARLRAGRRWAALGGVLPGLWQAPGWLAVRNLLSLLRG